MHLPTLKTPPYSNCKMLSPDGILMCRMSRRRVDWYVTQGLAKVVDHNPYTIQLIFQPGGLGNHNDKYYLADKENICVVCGQNEELTKHHVLPRCFRKYFPNHIKNDNSHDVLLLCFRCHEAYEIHAYQLKMKIIGNKRVTYIRDEDKNKINAIKSARTLLRHTDEIPDDRAFNLMLKIEEYAGDYNDEIVRTLANDTAKYHETTVWKDAVNNIRDYNEFTRMWREHFIETMNPKHLPAYWDKSKRLLETRV